MDGMEKVWMSRHVWMRLLVFQAVEEQENGDKWTVFVFSVGGKGRQTQE